jgi:diguanylate cyclase (GGDEF)-like protein
MFEEPGPSPACSDRVDSRARSRVSVVAPVVPTGLLQFFQSSAAPVAETGDVRMGKRIIIADHDKSFLSTVAARLVAGSHQVSIATSMPQAIEAVQAERPDLILASLDLPGGGGVELQECLANAGLTNVPFVFLDSTSTTLRQQSAPRPDDRTVVLPRSAPLDMISSVIEETFSASTARPRAGQRKRQLSVLVIEDDEAQFLLITKCLLAPGRESVEITRATTIEQAMSLIGENKFSCVLIDHQLADGTGLSVLEEREQELLTTPVIGLSANDDPAVALRYFRGGCVEFFIKHEVLSVDILRRGIAHAMARFQRRVMAAIIERRQLGHAINESQEGLIALARTDRLMGICNRAVLDEYLPEYHLEVIGKGGTYGLCMIDVDRFKAYNDHYGHQGGDEVLREVAQVLTSTLRENDFIARYGGEEIVVVLDDVNETAAESVANRLRKLVFDHNLPQEHNPPDNRVTVSLGVAVFDAQRHRGETVHSVLARADEAVYAAKAAGRNQVKLWTPHPKAHRKSA